LLLPARGGLVLGRWSNSKASFGLVIKLSTQWGGTRPRHTRPPVGKRNPTGATERSFFAGGGARAARMHPSPSPRRPPPAALRDPDQSLYNSLRSDARLPSAHRGVARVTVSEADRVASRTLLSSPVAAQLPSHAVTWERLPRALDADPRRQRTIILLLQLFTPAA